MVYWKADKLVNKPIYNRIDRKLSKSMLYKAIKTTNKIDIDTVLIND